MNTSKIKAIEGGKVVIMSRPFDTKDKLLYLIYAMAFIFTSLIFTWVFLYENMDLFGTLLILGFVLLSIVVFFRFFRRATEFEKLIIDATQLTIVKGSIFGNSKAFYELSKISNFSHLAKPVLTDHPLNGQSFDYFGFQTEQKVINEMHGDNRISFKYGDKYITFGKDVYSWEFEEIEIAIYNVSGNDLRYKDSDEELPK